MFLTSKNAGASPFQHVINRLNLTNAKKAEDEEEKKDARAEDGDDKDDKKSKKSKKAEGDKEDSDSDEKKNDAKADSDGDNDDEKPEPKGKKSKSKKADDGDQEKDDEPNARAAERKRISDILLSAEANASEAAFVTALGMALETDMQPGAVKAIIRGQNMAAGAAAKPAATTEPKREQRVDALRDRMAQNPKVDLGAGSDEGGQELTFAQKVVLAGKKRRGEI